MPGVQISEGGQLQLERQWGPMGHPVQSAGPRFSSWADRCSLGPNAEKVVCRGTPGGQRHSEGGTGGWSPGRRSLGGALQGQASPSTTAPNRVELWSVATREGEGQWLSGGASAVHREGPKLRCGEAHVDGEGIRWNLAAVVVSTGSAWLSLRVIARPSDLAPAVSQTAPTGRRNRERGGNSAEMAAGSRSTVEGQVVALLVQNLERLDENVKEEADGVHNTLAIIENMAEFRPEMCSDAAQQGLMQWLLKRLKAKMPFDANKLYCSEVLAILLQNKDDNRELLGELEGIDVLLQQLSVSNSPPSRPPRQRWSRVPVAPEPNSSTLTPINKVFFCREKKISRSSALKVLDHAMIGPEGADNCHKFVDILGLRTIFPLFMKSPKKVKKVGTSEKEHEEHVCSILASLLRNLRGQQRTRLLNKFTENDSEKVDRLMELYFKYLDAMQVANKKIEGEKHDMVRRGEIIDDDQEDEFYLRRLDAGLFVLQLICYIMAEICSSNIAQIRQRVLQILNMRGSSVKIVRHIIKEYAENISDGKNPEYQESEQKRIAELLENF
ncbi:beta-catenin-like protein 1 [Sphaerodactylus townsendi]|nr:beta-catenin-like protein 1 [Sphaerodactylus townsendi]